LAPLLLMILLTVAWSWLGSLPVKVGGRCILLNPTGLADVVSAVSGRVLTLSVKVGDAVQEGQEVAHIAQPELLDRIDQATARLRELEAQGRVVKTFSERGEVLTTQTLAQNRHNLESQLKAALAHVRLAADRVAVQGKLLKDGLVTAQTLVATRQEKVQAELEAEGLRHQIKQLELRRLEAEKLSRNEVTSIESQISEARRALASLEEARRQATRLESPFGGRVVELKTGPGMLVGQGSPVLTVERFDASGGLQALVYVPASDGKKVRLGMEAQISPSTVRREEHGFMVGRVERVADYPATPQSMGLLLQNDALVRELAGSAPPFEARVGLVPASNPSGYQWSSAAGAPVKLTSGTLCRADILVDRQRPIALVIPIFRQSVGLD
ncbi:MAG: NHLP bacteriocin system secretion protein, partial [Pseudomonadota bacterium]